MNQHVPCTEFSDLDKIAKSARDARVWLEEDKQRYTPGFDSHGKPRVIDESPGLFKGELYRKVTFELDYACLICHHTVTRILDKRLRH